MAKASKAERAAFDAVHDAAAAAKNSRRVAKDLPKKSASRIRDLADDAARASDVSKKAVRKRPKKVEKRVRRATDRLVHATDKAIDKAEHKSALAAEAERRKKQAKRTEAEAARRAADAEAARLTLEAEAARRAAEAEERKRAAAKPAATKPAAAPKAPRVRRTPSRAATPAPASDLGSSDRGPAARARAGCGQDRLLAADEGSARRAARLRCPRPARRSSSTARPLRRHRGLSSTSCATPRPGTPEASAIDDGSGALSYRSFSPSWIGPPRGCMDAGRAPGRPGRGARRVRARKELYVAILGDPRRRRRVCARRRGRPRRARPARLRRGGGARDHRRRRRVRSPIGCRGAPRPAPAPHRSTRPRRPPRRRRRLDHLHLGLDGRAQGRRRHATAPPPRSSTPRRGCSCRTRRSGPATGCSPDCRWPSTPPARRCGSPGGTAPASCPRRDRSCARGDGPRPLAGRARRSPSSRPCRPSRRCGRSTRSRTSGCSSSAARRARPSSPTGWRPTAARSGTPTARPRPPWSRARRRSATTGRCGSACRSTAGRSPSSTPRATPVAEGEVGELIIGGVGLARYLDPAKDAEKYAPMPSLGWDRAYRCGDLVRFEAEGLCSSRAAPTTR